MGGMERQTEMENPVPPCKMEIFGLGQELYKGGLQDASGGGWAFLPTKCLLKKIE